MNWKPISPRTHGIIDYVVGAVQSTAAGIMKKRGVDSRVVALHSAMAGGNLGYSVFTDYPYGIKRVLPMKAHLAMDVMAASVMIASPWLLGLKNRGKKVWLPQVLTGVAELGVVAMTRTR